MVLSWLLLGKEAAESCRGGLQGGPAEQRHAEISAALEQAMHLPPAGFSGEWAPPACAGQESHQATDLRL